MGGERDVVFFKAGRWSDLPATSSGRVSSLIIGTRHSNEPVLQMQQGYHRWVLPKASEKRNSIGSQRFALKDKLDSRATKMSVICV